VNLVYLLEMYYLCRKKECLAHVFTMGTELACDRNPAHMSGFPSVRYIHLMENSPMKLNCRNSCISWKNTIYIRSTCVLPMFLYENWVSKCNEYSLLSAFKSGGNSHFKKNSLIQLNWWIPYISWKCTISFSRWSVLPMFSLWEPSCHIAGILPSC
jgi:hypothetical protein